MEEFLRWFLMPDGKIRLDLNEFDYNDDVLVVPLCPSSIPMIEIATDMGYQMVSPSDEADSPYNDLGHLRQNYSSDFSIAYICKIVTTSINGQTAVLEHSRNDFGAYNPRPGYMADKEIDLHITIIHPDKEDTHVIKSVDYLMLSKDEEFEISWLFTQKCIDEQIDLKRLGNIASSIREYWDIPNEYPSENRTFLGMVEDARLLLSFERDIKRQPGPIGIQAALRTFDISEESIKEYTASLN